MQDIKSDKFKTNPFAKKYKHSLAMRDMARKGSTSDVPKVMRRDAVKKALDSKKK